MRRRLSPEDVAKARANIKDLLKAGKKLDDLDDDALKMIAVLAEEELRKRSSPLAARGVSGIDLQFMKGQ